jgi:hypothetical protein
MTVLFLQVFIDWSINGYEIKLTLLVVYDCHHTKLASMLEWCKTNRTDSVQQYWSGGKFSPNR